MSTSPIEPRQAQSRACSRFSARLARGGFNPPLALASDAAAALGLAADREGLLCQARSQVLLLVDGGRHPPLDLVLEAAACARGMRCWDELSARLQRTAGMSVSRFPEMLAYAEGARPTVDDALRATGRYPHPGLDWLGIAHTLDGAGAAHADAAAEAWIRVHPGGRAGFLAFVDTALRSGSCTLAGERAMGSTWRLCMWPPGTSVGMQREAAAGGNTAISVYPMSQMFVWWMAKRHHVYVPCRSDAQEPVTFAQAAPPPHSWRGQRLLGEPDARLDAVIWLTQRLGHARSALQADAVTTKAQDRVGAYATRLRQVQISAPCPVCDGGEDQPLMASMCQACGGGTGYAFDG